MRYPKYSTLALAVTLVAASVAAMVALMDAEMLAGPRRIAAGVEEAAVTCG